MAHQDSEAHYQQPVVMIQVRSESALSFGYKPGGWSHHNEVNFNTQNDRHVGVAFWCVSDLFKTNEYSYVMYGCQAMSCHMSVARVFDRVLHISKLLPVSHIRLAAHGLLMLRMQCCQAGKATWSSLQVLAGCLYKDV